MNWGLLALSNVIFAIVAYICGYVQGRKRAKNDIQTVGELIVYDFEGDIEPELYLELDAHPETFKTLSHVLFRTRNIKLGKPPRTSQK